MYYEKYEYNIVEEFSNIIDLKNQTYGTIHIYKGNQSNTRRDGYYYKGVTFILDAKRPNIKFNNQLESYMNYETNNNFLAFKYNGKDFQYFIKQNGG